MNLHEYQAKALFAEAGIPVPQGGIAANADEAVEVAKTLGFERCVVKAQVHAGGRGKAGGVKLVNDREEMIQAVEDMIGTNLVTYQTDEQGQPIHHVLIEAPCVIARELYLGAVVDRVKQQIVFMASTEGGVEIEKVAEQTPEKIIQVAVDPLVGALPFQGRDVAFRLGLRGDQVKQFVKLYINMANLFKADDFSLLEINPLVVTEAGDLICLDGKINLDENALYRQPALCQMRDTTQEDERERQAKEWALNYVSLQGNIGCMVNGAGLAMATMDLIKLTGGQPANFLDVGGGATQERVAEALKIILSDQHVKGILVNIFGGIVRCDLIADGIIGAVADVGITVPIVVRLEGNNADLGMKKLEESGLRITAAKGLINAAECIVKAVSEEASA